ncbi:PREDICTED: U-box domain-containing protein 7 [Nicotiana attenuata]|uniref:U-box domain-containing protein 7 n=1 Tax=Nicotiana attenuata TaxID=49451 RepID=A0A314KRN6_NICAT|nr:PREDICTED: U-box domain-containing protein 7 [Nicotiana attenuata]OIT31996.1 u-box domain-containing protein 7 [Nicotiana attenuata]
MEEMVVEALLFGDRQAQLFGARQIGQFSSKQRHKIVEKGIVPPLILMLSTNDYEAIEAALFALLSIAFRSERNKIVIAKSGAIQVLLDVLQCENEMLVELAVAFLLTLSSCASNKLAIAASGTIPLVLELLNSQAYNSMSLQANLDILSILHNLSTCHQLIPSIVSSGGVAILLGLISLASETKTAGEVIAEKAMVLLENIVSSSRIGLEEAAGTGGAIQCLVEAMEEGSRQCKEDAVAILLLICESCRERYRGMILREGAMAALLQLSVDGTKRARDNAKRLLLLLRDRSHCSPKNKQPKNILLLEHVMRQIEQGVGERAGMSVAFLEEMISKLRT